MTNNKEKEIKKNNQKQVKPKKENEIKKLKQENSKLTENIINLINQVNELKLNNEKSIQSFQEKAKTFQDKAQQELNKSKKELQEKFENDLNEAKKYLLQKTFENIVDPLINMEIAIKAGKNQSQEVQNYVIGFEMLMSQLLNELESVGLTKIVPKENEDFNPEYHQITATQEGPKDKIMIVKKPGFKLYDRVIKPAIVIVGK